MQNTENQILAKIKKARGGTLFFTDGFAKFGKPDTVRQALQRLVKSGKIDRVSAGIFVRPQKDDIIGKVMPDIIYQVGVATVNDFSKSAVEFAANNKIPLLSLSWFLDEEINKFNKINQSLIDDFKPEDIEILYKFFKKRGYIPFEEEKKAHNLLSPENVIGDIVTTAESKIKKLYVGMLETEIMIFLSIPSSASDDILNQPKLKARVFYQKNRPNMWRLSVYEDRDNSLNSQETDFYFYLPKQIFDHWRTFKLDPIKAIDLKKQLFSKIFVFNKGIEKRPFSIIEIDKDWLREVREENI